MCRQVPELDGLRGTAFLYRGGFTGVAQHDPTRVPFHLTQPIPQSASRRLTMSHRLVQASDFGVVTAVNCATAALSALPMISITPRRHACPDGEMIKSVFAVTRPMKTYSTTVANMNATSVSANRRPKCCTCSTRRYTAATRRSMA